MRLFVAVWPDDPTAAVLADLPRPAVPGLRWTSPEQWHVTLAFLGPVPGVELPALTGRLDVALRSTGPCDATLGPAVEAFGDAVLHAPVDGLDHLADAVRGATGGAAAGFRGHLTLARARAGLPVGVIGAPVSATWTVREVALVASETHPEGARYTTVAVVPLDGPAPSDPRPPAAGRSSSRSIADRER